MNAVNEIKNRQIVHWFRNDQRVSDHEIISNMNKFDSLTTFYVHADKYDKNHALGFPWISENRKAFLNDSLLELASHLKFLGIEFRQFNSVKELISSGLLIGKTLTYQRIYSMEEQKQELEVIQHHNEQVFTFDGFTLVDNANLPFELHKIPQVFTAFKNKIEKYGAFNKCVALPNLPTNALTFAQKGGENYGLSRLKYYLQDTDLIANYKQTRNGMLGTDYSSRFSPWLALGNLSARTIAYYIYQYEKDVNANESTYWLIFELLWRDFFQLNLRVHQNKFFKKGGIQEKQGKWRTTDSIFWKWANGETGDELVDANMRELNTTAWMSNRGRQNVASYLIHDLGIDWRLGAAYLESKLIDYDPASNWGNWMYIAGVGHDPRPFRKFDTVGQADRYDPSRNYRDLWLK